MSTTYATRLTGDEGRFFGYVVVIQGISTVFSTVRVDVPDEIIALAGWGDGSNHVQHRGVFGKLDIGEKTLDLERRRMVGGSLTVELVDLEGESGGPLSALFAPRSRPLTFLKANITKTDNALSVPATSLIPGVSSSAVTLFCGGETIITDGTTSPTDIDIFERGAFGSEAQAHFGGSEQGAGIFTTPPSWFGRRVKLIGFFLNDDMTTTADLAMVVDTYRISEAPAFIGNNGWRLECSHLSDELLQRKLGTGIREIEVKPEAITNIAGNLSIEMLDNLASLYLAQGSLPSYALIDSAGSRQTWVTSDSEGNNEQRHTRTSRAGIGIHKIAGIAVDRFAVSPVNRVSPGVNVDHPKTVKHIAILDSGNPGLDVVIALTSRLGDGANGTYDQLGGFKRLGYVFDGFQLGAGILAAEVDVDAFLAIGATSLKGISFVIDGEVTVDDFLDDFCLATNSFRFVTRNGLLSVKRLGEERLASTMTIDDDVILSGGDPEVTYLERAIFPRAKFSGNYDPVSGENEYTVNVVDDEMVDRYPNIDNALEIESRAIVVEGGATGGGNLDRPTMSFEDLRLLLRRIQVGGGRGAGVVRMQCTVAAMILDLGDVALLTVAVPDLEGADNISGRVVRITGLELDPDEGRVVVTAEILETLFFIAPACLVASRVGAVLTLQTTGPENSSGANPADMFGVGWAVALHDISAANIEFFTVLAAAGVSITLDAVPGFAIQAGVDFLTLDTQLNIAGETESANELTPREFTYLQNNTQSIADPVTRWR